MKTIILMAMMMAGVPNPASLTLADYHALQDSGIQTGGVKMVSLETPVVSSMYGPSVLETTPP